MRTLRVVAEALYRVEENFPRLTPATFTTGVPPGISHVSYTLAMAACARHLVARSPTEAAWTTVRRTLL